MFPRILHAMMREFDFRKAHHLQQLYQLFSCHVLVVASVYMIKTLNGS